MKKILINTLFVLLALGGLLNNLSGQVLPSGALYSNLSHYTIMGTAIGHPGGLFDLIHESHRNTMGLALLNFPGYHLSCQNCFSLCMNFGVEGQGESNIKGNVTNVFFTDQLLLNMTDYVDAVPKVGRSLTFRFNTRGTTDLLHIILDGNLQQPALTLPLFPNGGYAEDGLNHDFTWCQSSIPTGNQFEFYMDGVYLGQFQLNLTNFFGGDFTYFGLSACNDLGTWNSTTVSVNPVLCAPLPIDVLTFEGKEVDKTGMVQLDFETRREVGNNFFTVERRKGETGEPEAIHILDSKGTNEQGADYSYMDAFPAIGRNYYRLMATDLDGTETYSEWITVEVEGIPANPFLLGPNPVRAGQSLLVRVKSEVAGPYRLQIFSEAGVQLAAYNLLEPEGMVSPDLGRGRYLAVMEIGREQFYRWVVIW